MMSSIWTIVVRRFILASYETSERPRSVLVGLPLTACRRCRRTDAGSAPMALDDPRLTGQGGTPTGAAAAREDSWQKAIAFLKAHLNN